jgi:hypothetical protein
MAEWLDEYIGPSEPLPCYDEPDAKWETLLQQAASQPGVGGGSISSVQWYPRNSSPDDVMPQILRALAQDGCVVVRDLTDLATASRIREQMEPFMGSTLGSGSSAVFNHETPRPPPESRTKDSGRRAGAVVARAEASWGLVTHPLLVDLCAGVLGRQVLMKRTPAEMQSQLFKASPQSDRSPFKQHPYQLDFAGLIEVQANGGAAQDEHLDFGKHIFEFRGFLDASITVLWALTPFTSTNGATRIAVGSHRWPLERVPRAEDFQPACMEAGSCLIFRGGCFHGGGQNATDTSRCGLVTTFSLGWLRQEENQYLVNGPEVVRRMPRQLQRLLGFGRAGNSLGMVMWDGRGSIDPLAAVDERWGTASRL